MNTPTRTALNTTDIEPLVKIEGHQKEHPRIDPGVPLTVYDATCRDCGPLHAITDYPTLAHASLLRKRHLAEHLTALAAEIAEANR